MLNAISVNKVIPFWNVAEVEYTITSTPKLEGVKNVHALAAESAPS